MRQIRIYDNNKTIGKCKEAIVEDIFMNSIDFNIFADYYDDIRFNMIRKLSII